MITAFEPVDSVLEFYYEKSEKLFEDFLKGLEKKYESKKLGGDYRNIVITGRFKEFLDYIRKKISPKDAFDYYYTRENRKQSVDFNLNVLVKNYFEAEIETNAKVFNYAIYMGSQFCYDTILREKGEWQKLNNPKFDPEDYEYIREEIKRKKVDTNEISHILSVDGELRSFENTSFRVAMMTNKGAHEQNEDGAAVILDDETLSCLVCDGVSNSKGSEKFVQAFMDMYVSNSDLSFEELLRKFLLEVKSKEMTGSAAIMNVTLTKRQGIGFDAVFEGMGDCEFSVYNPEDNKIYIKPPCNYGELVICMAEKMEYEFLEILGYQENLSNLSLYEKFFEGVCAVLGLRIKNKDFTEMKEMEYDFYGFFELLKKCEISTQKDLINAVKKSVVHSNISRFLLYHLSQKTSTKNLARLVLKNNLVLGSGDLVYIRTDGYADSFGPIDTWNEIGHKFVEDACQKMEALHLERERKDSTGRYKRPLKVGDDRTIAVMSIN